MDRYSGEKTNKQKPNNYTPKSQMLKHKVS